jgi:hypothetical protein
MPRSSAILSLVLLAVMLTMAHASQRMGNIPYRYAVVIRNAAYTDAGWKAVADTLVKKHGTTLGAQLFTWQNSVTEVQTALSTFKPDYIGFVCRPVADVDSIFIHTASDLARALDGDPYTDAIWGIVTGYTSADAMRAIHDSVIVKTTLSAYLTAMTNPTPANPPQRWYYQSIATYEPWQDFTPPWNIDQLVYNLPDGTVKTMKNDSANIATDRIVTFSQWLNAKSIDVKIPGGGEITGPVDLFTTSGHGNVNVWQAHYPVPASEGYLVSQGGQLYGSPYQGSAIPITCQTPKVYLATGNCLIGNPNGTGNMPYAWFHTGRCVQMFGYIIETNYEYLGWGQWFRFSEFPGVYNVAESWFITNNSMMFDLINKTAGIYDQAIMTQFLDNTVVYGDPAAVAYMDDLGDSSHPYLEKVRRAKGSGTAPDTFEYTATGHLTSGPTSNGTSFYYGLRPFWYLPSRIDPATVTVQRNDGHTPVITENFMLWSMLEGSTETLAKGASKVLRWTAKTVEDRTPVQSPVVNNTFTDPRCALRTCPGRRGIEILRNGMRDAEIGVSIYNAAGKLVLKSNFRWSGNSPEESQFIGMGNAVRGMYYAVVRAGAKTQHEAFVFLD